jgi:hypothetical protein
MSEKICVTVTRQDKYRFLLDFGPGVPQSAGDEPPPLGDGAGPSPEQFLGAAVANCLCSSFVLAANKFKGDPGRRPARQPHRIGIYARRRCRGAGYGKRRLPAAGSSRHRRPARNQAKVSALF